MQFSFQNPVIAAMAAGLSGTIIAGCDQWPRYKHKPSTNENALQPGTDPSSGVDLKWTEINENTEPNDAPEDGFALSVGDGLLVEGTLNGLGWDPQQITDRVSECGDALAFPPAAPGAYIGDVDWISIAPEENGLLCLQMLSDHPTARLDVGLYVLDDCNEPVGVFVHPETTVPIGLDVAASDVRWAIGVDPTVTVAIGMAGFFPDDATLSLDWTASVALVPSIDGAADSLCPGVQ